MTCQRSSAKLLLTIFLKNMEPNYYCPGFPDRQAAQTSSSRKIRRYSLPLGPHEDIIIPEESEQNSAYVEKDDLDAAQQVKPASLKTAGGKSLVGYLNLIHPHQIQVIGGVELKYIEGLRDITRHDAVKQLFRRDLACIIIADDKRVPAFLKRKCNDRNVPLFLTPVSSTRLTDFLHYYLVNLFADLVTLHGVFMEVMMLDIWNS